MDDSSSADDLISGSLKRSASYHAAYGAKSYRDIKKLARKKPPDAKAKQMKKLIEQAERLRAKARKRQS